MRLKNLLNACWLSLLSLLLMAAPNPASALDEFGSSILDVPYVPTRDEVVQAMLKMAQVSEQDLLYDLGSGDGRIVVTAAKERGARGVGIDLDPRRVREAKANAKSAGVEEKVEFIQGDIFETDFSQASVITMYLLPAVNIKLRPRILSEMPPGTRIVSHAFDMGDWEPDQKDQITGSYVYLWIVPAPVEGAWRWRGSDGRDYQVELEQKYQQVQGRAWIDDRPAQLQSAELKGDLLRLTLQADDAARPIKVSARYADGRLFDAANASKPIVWKRVAKQDS